MTFTERFEIRKSDIQANAAPLAGAGVFFRQPAETDLYAIRYSSIWQSTVSNNVGSGIGLNSVSSLSIRESEVSENSSHGVEMLGAAESAHGMTVGESVIRSNGGSGIYVHPNVIAGVSVYSSEIGDNEGFGVKAGPHATISGRRYSGTMTAGYRVLRPMTLLSTT